jgi:hypothetical protein
MVNILFFKLPITLIEAPPVVAALHPLLVVPVVMEVVVLRYLNWLLLACMLF